MDNLKLAELHREDAKYHRGKADAYNEVIEKHGDRLIRPIADDLRHQYKVNLQKAIAGYDKAIEVLKEE